MIKIRPFEPEDVPGFFAAVRDSVEALGRWMPWCHANYSIDEANSWLATCQAAWAQGTSYPFLIVQPDSNEVIGSVDINQTIRIITLATLDIGFPRYTRGKVLRRLPCGW